MLYYYYTDITDLFKISKYFENKINYDSNR